MNTKKYMIKKIQKQNFLNKILLINIIKKNFQRNFKENNLIKVKKNQCKKRIEIFC